ncbi:MAG: sugar ABC transporter permease [Butyrivibrio sp.]|nr:sugar ABC transporter permease [Butyrivibrio sp.]
MNLSKRRSISYAKYGYLFILPFFIVYIFFQIYPLCYTFYLSTQSNGKTTTEFVGLSNFKTLLFGGGFAAKAAHDSFVRVLGNTFILWVGNFIPQIIISLLLAAWFTDAYLKIKGKGFYKIVMYMPNIITAASVAALFVMLFSDSQLGAVNSIIAKGDPTKTIPFVGGLNNEPRIMIMIIQTWMWFGNTTIMLMSGIMGINPSLFEAANIDGASPNQQFFRITIPLLRPILLYTVVTSMIGGLQMFDIPYLYKNGTVVNKTTETIACYIYSNFHSTAAPNYGYSAGASVILFFITAILGAIAFMTNRDEDPRSAHAKNSKKSSLKTKLGGV